MASSIHLDKNNGLAPVNRRISIIVLNETETEQILHEYDGATPLNELLNKPQQDAEASSIENAEKGGWGNSFSSSINAFKLIFVVTLKNRLTTLSET